MMTERFKVRKKRTEEKTFTLKDEKWWETELEKLKGRDTHTDKRDSNS